MPADPDDPTAVTTYRFAPGVVARLAGGLLIVLALALGVVTLVVAVSGLSAVVVVVVAAVGALAVGAAVLALHRMPVVRFAPGDFRVRAIRGVGVASAPWTQVHEAVTATRDGLPLVVLRLDDDRSASIPVTVLDTDREEFVRVLQGYLQRGHGLRPLA